MNYENISKKEQKKLKLRELALIAISNIKYNNILIQNLSLYQEQLNIIKLILEKKMQINTDNNSKNDISKSNNNKLEDDNFIQKDFISFYENIKKSVDTLRETNKKLLEKYQANNNIIFDESSFAKLDLKKSRTDIFLLINELKQKNDIIKKLNENVFNSRKHSVFREKQRETEVSRNMGLDYMNNENLNYQRDLQIASKDFNKFINKYKGKIKMISELNIKKNYLNDIIAYFEKEQKLTKYNYEQEQNFDINSIIKNKKKSKNNRKKINMDNNYNSMTIDGVDKNYRFHQESSSDEGDMNHQTIAKHQKKSKFLFPNDDFNLKNKDKEKKKKYKQEFEFLTVDELFNIDNIEGEKEVIIQEELHSDDEVIFEKKIKNKNRINTIHLEEVKKIVPKLYLNQIEFNKKKVMNEADLYSFQRREYNKKNVDENIKIMKKRIKILKKKNKTNVQKLNALINFIKKANEEYEVLKPIKIVLSMKDYDIRFMKKEFYNHRNNKNAIIEEVDEDKKDGEDIEDEDSYSDRMKKKNNYNVTEANFDEKDNKKILNYDDDNRAKSK